MDELELSILNAITKYKSLALDFAFTVDIQFFSTSESRIIAKTFLDYIKTYKNKPSLKALLHKHSEENDLCNYIKSFFENVKDIPYDESDYAYDLSKLKQAYSERRLGNIKNRMGGDIIDITSTVKDIEREIGAIKTANSQKTYDRKTIDNYVDDFRTNFIEKTKNPDVGKGILTGYSFLDYIKNGLRPADLIIIAGESGSGKSILMNNMAIQIYMQNNRVDMTPEQFGQGYNVAYFSLEMPYEDCFRRTLARMADVQEYGIRDAKLSVSEARGVSQACKFMKHYPYKFEIIDVPRGFSVAQLEVMFEEIKTEYIPDVVFIDYLGLMEDIENDNDDWLAIGQLTGKIHEFARSYSIPVVTAVQLNRIDPNFKKSEAKSIGLHRIGRSNLIATHATLIIQIETRQDEETHDDFIYHIIKNRYGQSNKSHSIYKNLNKCSIIDKPYDSGTAISWIPNEDISDQISEILGGS